MDTQLFAVKDLIKEGWRLTKANLGFLIAYQFILFVLNLALGFAGREDSLQYGLQWTVLHFLGWVVVPLANMGLYNSSLLITAAIKPGFDQLYRNWRLFVSWIVASILFGIMFIIGLLLLVVPGFYVLARFGLFHFFVLDKNLGPIEALKQTAKATEGITWPIFVLYMACLGLNIVGLLFLGIGLLVTVPVTILALATIYRRISHRAA